MVLSAQAFMGPDFMRRVNASVAPADADRSRAGVEPERLRFPWWRGPRTEAAGFTGTTWPVTSQSNKCRRAAKNSRKRRPVDYRTMPITSNRSRTH